MQSPHELPPSLIFVTGGVQHDFGMDLDESSDVSVTRTRATIGFHRRLDDDWVLRGQIGADHAHYDWSSDALSLGSNRGELQVDDADGHEIETTDLGPAPWLGLGVLVAF